MEWIAIKDRMPKANVNVLVYFVHDGLEYIEIGWNDPDFARGMEAFGMHISHDEYQHEITHWMPLPNAPNNSIHLTPTKRRK